MATKKKKIILTSTSGKRQTKVSICCSQTISQKSLNVAGSGDWVIINTGELGQISYFEKSIQYRINNNYIHIYYQSENKLSIIHMNMTDVLFFSISDNVNDIVCFSEHYYKSIKIKHTLIRVIIKIKHLCIFYLCIF